MKKSLILLLSIITSISSFSQIEELTGIGVFRIGETKLENLDSLCESVKIKKSKDMGTYERQTLLDGKKYVEVIFNPSSRETDYDAPMHPDIKRFLISKYVIKDVYLFNFILTFYQGKLAEMEFKGDLDKVEEVFKAKFGDPTVTFNEKPIPFVFTYTGNTIEKYEKEIDARWYNGNIQAKKYMYLGYTNSGIPFTLKYINISDTIISKKIFEKNVQGLREWSDNQKQINDEAKKANYKGF